MVDLNSIREIIPHVQTTISGLRRTLETPYHAQVRQNADEASSILRELLRDLEGARLTLAPVRVNQASQNYDDIVPHIVSLIVELKNISTNPDYVPFLRSIPYRPLESEKRTLLGVPKTSMDAIQTLIGLLQSVGPASDPSNSIPHDLFQLNTIVPAQKIAPAQFALENGRVALKRTKSISRNEDKANIDNARSELLKNGQGIVQELERSNCDPRLVENFQNLQVLLSDPTDAIKIGIANLSCEIMATAFDRELPSAVAAMLKAHARGIQLFVGQFPEWNRFLENAAAAHLSNQDVEELRIASEDVIAKLRARPDLVEPEVPKTLSFLTQMLENPSGAGKRAAFAVLRSMENLISFIFKAGAEFGQKTINKTVDSGSSFASRMIVIAMLSLALSSATSIGPIASKIPEMSWLRTATDLVKKQLEQMAAGK